VVKEEKSDALYVIADAFREKFSQILGQELSVISHFDGNCCLCVFAMFSDVWMIVSHTEH